MCVIIRIRRINATAVVVKRYRPGQLAEITTLFVNADVEAFAFCCSIFNARFQHTHAAYMRI